MNYTLHQLQIFIKVAEIESITKAAEELHLTQPAVSIQLKNLQNQFDVPLIESIGRGIYVTDFGKEIVEAGKRILEEVEQIESKTLAYQGHMTGKLSISIVSTAKYLMPYFLTDFMKLYPNIDLKMDVTNKGMVINSLENNEVDFAMVSVLPDKLQVDRVELMPNELYLMGRADADIGDQINLKTLERLPLLYREPGSATRYAMENFIKKNRIDVQKKIELTSNEAVKQSLLAGLGYSIMPLIGIRNELTSKELKIIKIKGLPIVTTWNLVWRKDKTFSPIAEVFLEYIKKSKDSIIKNKFGWYSNHQLVSKMD